MHSMLSLAEMARLLLFPRALITVESRIERVEVLGIQTILYDAQRFPEPLEVYDLSPAQESDRIADVVVVDQAQDIVVGGAGLLLGRHVFRQVSADIGIKIAHLKNTVKWAHHRKIYYHF